MNSSTFSCCTIHSNEGLNFAPVVYKYPPKDNHIAIGSTATFSREKTKNFCLASPNIVVNSLFFCLLISSSFFVVIGILGEKGTTCQYGHAIEFADGTFKCICKVCGNIYSPVCGNDLVTYASECHFNHEKCSTRDERMQIQDYKACGMLLFKFPNVCYLHWHSLEKWPYSDFFWSLFSPNAGKYELEKLRVRILFAQWLVWVIEIINMMTLTIEITHLMTLTI